MISGYLFAYLATLYSHIAASLQFILNSLFHITTLFFVYCDILQPPVGSLNLNKLFACLKFRPNCENLMYQILNTLNSIFARGLGNEGIICRWDTGAIYLSIPTLVNEVTNRLAVGF